MSELRWIISKHKYFEHKTFAEAKAELDRLKAIDPAIRFRLYRVKRVTEETTQTTTNGETNVGHQTGSPGLRPISQPLGKSRP
jgi:hypothetical protein